MATVLGSSREGGVVEGNVVADEGVGEGDEAPRDGDEGDLGRFSGDAQVEIGLLEFRMAARCDERGHVEGRPHAGSTPGDGVAPAGKPGLRGMGGKSSEAGGRLAVDGAQFRHLDDDESRDARADARDRGQNGAPARHSVLGVDAAVEIARGMTVREIQGHLLELYGLEVSPDLISTVTDAVLETVAEWQNRPLEPMYPLVFFDALRVKIRDEGLVRNKAVYVALGVTPEGTKDILGLWIETSEGAKFWLRVMTELKNRGVEDILIAVVDGLKGFPEAIAAVFPPTIVQTCIVHLSRNSMDFAAWKDRKPIAAELKAIYRATDTDVARRALEDFDAGVWGRKYPAIAQSWRRNWEHVIPFFAFPVAVRRIIYTTNAIESLNAKLRRAVRTRGHFPTDEAAIKLLYLVLRQVAQTWKMPPREWCEAKTKGHSD